MSRNGQAVERLDQEGQSQNSRHTKHDNIEQYDEGVVGCAERKERQNRAHRSQHRKINGQRSDQQLQDRTNSQLRTNECIEHVQRGKSNDQRQEEKQRNFAHRRKRLHQGSLQFPGLNSCRDPEDSHTKTVDHRQGNHDQRDPKHRDFDVCVLDVGQTSHFAAENAVELKKPILNRIGS